MYDVAKNNHLLASNFIPARFDGDLLLFSATVDRTGEEPPPEAWEPYISGEIRIREVPCRHQLMTEPDSLAIIGSILRTELERMTVTHGGHRSIPTQATTVSRDTPFRVSH
jgi:thioesterase domain-containing protein